jgi:crotonobetainyl-CoA:carnitine CoA-transferase CaiB-like acyl-CoA transferase
MSRTPLEPRGAPPALGQQTVTIMASLGYTAAEVAELAAAGVVVVRD